eukprot:34019_1
MSCCKKKTNQNKDEKDKEKDELTTFVYIKDTALKLLWPTFGYYNDVISDYLVLKDYFHTQEYGYFGITIFAMFCSLTAQTIFSKSVTTFKVTNTSTCLRILISMCYGTPLFILFYMINNEWVCKKRLKTQFPVNTNQNSNDNNTSDVEMKFMILDESIIENDRISIFKSYFQSSILTFVQVYILAQYIILKPANITLNYPSTTTQFIILLWSTCMSFKSLSDCAWGRIEVFISNTQGVGTGIKFLFRIRAIIETFIRALRFMICSIIFYNLLYGGSIGIIILLLEFIWKFIVCWWFGRGKQGIHMRFRLYTVATWMIFSHERFKQYPYFMRVCDIFIWTALITIIPIAITYTHLLDHTLDFDGVCTDFLQFRNNCIPIELILLLGIFWLILAICYYLTPPIFSMNYKSEIAQHNNMNAMVKKDELAHHQAIEMVNGSINFNEVNITTESAENSDQSSTLVDDINSETIDSVPKCFQCTRAMYGPISIQSETKIISCEHCNQVVTDTYYICVNLLCSNSDQRIYCATCCVVTVDTNRSKSMAKIHRNLNENKLQPLEQKISSKNNIRSNSMPTNPFQRGMGRMGIRDFTMSNAMMINTFNEPPNDKINDFKRGKGRFNQRDFTMDNYIMIDTFSNNNANMMNSISNSNEQVNNELMIQSLPNNISKPKPMSINNANPFRTKHVSFADEIYHENNNYEPQIQSLPVNNNNILVNNNSSNNNLNANGAAFIPSVRMANNNSLNNNSLNQLNSNISINNNMNNTQSFTRGADYTTIQSPVINRFNPSPINNVENNKNNFQRGKGRFNNDYTMTQSRMIHNYNNEMNNKPKKSKRNTFKRGNGRFSMRDYTTTNSPIIDMYSG